MGFTDRMGDVLAAGDVLVHSSAGLTVLEAIIRGCPVISYGFNHGHVRASNQALKRFGLAQVANGRGDLRPMLEQALQHRPEPDDSFARRPSTASLILANERYVRVLPKWRVRSTRAVTALATAGVVGLWVVTAAFAYSLLSNLAPIKPVTAVATTTHDVGVIVDANGNQVSALADVICSAGMQVSFAIDSASHTDAAAPPPAAVRRCRGFRTVA